MNNAIKQVSSPLFLTAAYGRSYATAEAAVRAWESGKDFQIVGGPYCSIRDLPEMGVEWPSGIYLLYDKGSVELVGYY